MAQHPIQNKHGQATPYFWTDKHVDPDARATIFRKSEDSVKKMRGVYYDCKAGRVVKE